MTCGNDDVNVITPGITATKTLNPAYIKEAGAALAKEMERNTQYKMKEAELCRTALHHATQRDAVMLPNKNVLVLSLFFFNLSLYR